MIESIINLPNPGHANMDSVTVANAISVPNSIAITVTIGMRMLGRRCAQTILLEGNPLARQNLMKSSLITSSVPALVKRITNAILNRAKLVAGITRCLKPSIVNILLSKPKTYAVSPRPDTGSHPRETENIMIIINPNQKVGMDIPRTELLIIIRVIHAPG